MAEADIEAILKFRQDLLASKDYSASVLKINRNIEKFLDAELMEMFRRLRVETPYTADAYGAAEAWFAAYKSAVDKNKDADHVQRFRKAVAPTDAAWTDRMKELYTASSFLVYPRVRSRARNYRLTVPSPQRLLSAMFEAMGEKYMRAFYNYDKFNQQKRFEILGLAIADAIMDTTVEPVPVDTPMKTATPAPPPTSAVKTPGPPPTAGPLAEPSSEPLAAPLAGPAANGGGGESLPEPAVDDLGHETVVSPPGTVPALPNVANPSVPPSQIKIPIGGAHDAPQTEVNMPTAIKKAFERRRIVAASWVPTQSSDSSGDRGFQSDEE